MLTIILGAFGAHVFKEILSLEALKNFETAVRYQMYHVLFLLFINTNNILSTKSKTIISTLIYIGIFCFCGSIYAITIGGINPKLIWFITHLGGLLFLIAWSLLFLNFIQKKAS